MLTTKRINTGISILSQVLRIFLILFTASILANCVWWILSPSNNGIFVQRSYLDVRDKATRYIDNRAPFGVVVVKPKVQEKPRITDLLKLTGVYLNTAKDSFAFLEYQGKPVIAHTGVKISDSDAVIKTINPSSIIVRSDDQDVTIYLTTGGGTKSQLQSGAKNGQETMFGNSGDNSRSSNPREDFMQQRKKLIDNYNAHDGISNSSRSTSSNHNEDQH
ncbi:MAG: hypothetical protein K0R49_193 [Burkholderiales bacterium]|jgi:type II secretory pathway component PulC|nr:hypothetical protein [Burkholderiales bacterium]MCE3267941.1 hypothetical protein [Burkholderiales bacterium]